MIVAIATWVTRGRLLPTHTKLVAFSVVHFFDQGPVKFLNVSGLVFVVDAQGKSKISEGIKQTSIKSQFSDIPSGVSETDDS